MTPENPIWLLVISVVAAAAALGLALTGLISARPL
jgi:hypothetical protein